MSHVSDSEAERTIAAVIVNPVSSPLKVEELESFITSTLIANGWSVLVFRTQLTVSTKVLTQDAINRGAQFIVAAGGDGTIMEIINAVIGIDIPLGIIPLGTGNLLAINLGIPLGLREALEVVVSGASRSIDLVKVNGGQHYFAIMGGIGFDAQVMEETDRSSKLKFGRLAYIWTAVNNLEGRLFRARIEIDELQELVVDAKSILIANMGYLGINLNAFPEAVPDDGIMQVGVLKASNALEFVRLVAGALVSGAPETDSTFDVYTCRSLSIALASEQLFEYDGDIVGATTGIRAEVAPHCVTIKIPHPQ